MRELLAPRMPDSVMPARRRPLRPLSRYEQSLNSTLFQIIASERAMLLSLMSRR